MGAAEQEVEILEKLQRAEGESKRHIVQLLSTFRHCGHFCLVFECMWDDLREALRKFTKGRGMTLPVVRAYAQQLLLGLRHMHRCGIVHADIKPDNILMNDKQNLVKFCDLGTAFENTKAVTTPYLVSRSYRAPKSSSHVDAQLQSTCSHLAAPFMSSTLEKY